MRVIPFGFKVSGLPQFQDYNESHLKIRIKSWQ